MSLVLGRVGVDVVLADPDTWSRDGDRITLTGWADPGTSTVADGIVLSEQLAGLDPSVNPDEPAIACTWDQEPWFDGFYVVESVALGSHPASLATGWFPYSIRLRKIADGGSCRIDISIVGKLRTNGRTKTTGDAMVVVPSTSYAGIAHGGVYGTTADTTPSATNRLADTGDISVAFRINDVSAATIGYVSFDCIPSVYYAGSCHIRSGSTLRRVIGRRMRSGLASNWEIGNGLIRFTPSTVGKLKMEVYDNGTAAWGSARTFHLSVGGAASTNILSPNGDWRVASIIRNSPECVIMRFTLGEVSGLNSSYVLDINLRRGQLYATLTLGFAHDTLAGGSLGLHNSSAVASTALTGGVRETTADADGNAYLMCTDTAGTDDTAQGGVSATSVQSMNIMLGYSTQGGAAQYNANTDVRDQMFYVINERMKPRLR